MGEKKTTIESTIKILTIHFNEDEYTKLNGYYEKYSKIQEYTSVEDMAKKILTKSFIDNKKNNLSDWQSLETKNQKEHPTKKPFNIMFFLVFLLFVLSVVIAIFLIINK